MRRRRVGSVRGRGWAWSWRSTSSMQRGSPSSCATARSPAVATVARRRRAAPSGPGRSPRASSSSLTLEGADDAGRRRRQGPSDDPVSLATAKSPAPLRARGPLLPRVAPTVRIRTPACHHAAYDGRRGASSCSSRASRRGAPSTSSRACRWLAPSSPSAELAGLHAPHWGDDLARTATFVATSASRCARVYLQVAARLFDDVPRALSATRLTAATRAVVEWLAPASAPT